MTEAIENIRSQRRPDGDVWFRVDAPSGEPSKWVTFQALRALDWWDCESVRSREATNSS